MVERSIFPVLRFHKVQFFCLRGYLMPKIGTRERVAWLALTVLRSMERREGIIRRREAVRVLVERLVVSDRQAQNIILFLVREQLLVPKVEELRVSAFRLSAKGHATLERLGL